MSCKLLIIGLDGATFDLIQPWCEAGELPNLRRLLREGSSGVLLSTVPPATIPAWNSFMTGTNPGKHGLFDFTQHIPQGYKIRFVNASYRQRSTLWDLVGRSGKRVCVMGVPSTYPPEQINGIMISGFDSPVAMTIDPSFVHPPELFRELRETFGEVKISALHEYRFDEGWYESALEKLLAVLKVKAEIAEYLLTREPWDCFMVHFGESDTVSHHFWMFHDPGSPRYDPVGALRLGQAILRVYRELDAIVGRFLAMASEQTISIIVSDHGFGGAGRKALHLNQWLAQNGFLAFRARTRPGLYCDRIASALKRMGLSYLPGRLQEVLFRRGGWIIDSIEARVRFGGIDWSKTLAYSEELNYAPSIWINVRGRQSEGLVSPGNEYAQVRQTILKRLAELKDPETGERVVKRAYVREELYRGPFLERAPDVVLELNLDRGYSYTCLPSVPGAPPIRWLTEDECRGFKGRNVNGSHRREGVLILTGLSIERGVVLSKAAIEDVTPTILYLLGLPIPVDLDGRVLTEAIVEPARPLSSCMQASPTRQDAGQVRPYSLKQEAVLSKRLRDLGYL